MSITRLNPSTEYRKGNSVNLDFCGAGVLTSAKTLLRYTVPLSKPVASDVSGFAWSNVTRYEVRQNSSYVVSDFSEASSRAVVQGANGITVSEQYSPALTATNNDAVAIWLVGKLTFT